MSERVYYGGVVPGVPDEEFVVVGDEREAKFVNRMGSETGRTLRSRRMRHVLENGVVHDLFMPGTLGPVAEFVDEERWRRAVEAARQQERIRLLEGENVVLSRSIDLEVDGFEMKLDRNHNGHLKLDGHPLRGVQAVRVDCGANEHPRVTLSLIPVRPKDASEK